MPKPRVDSSKSRNTELSEAMRQLSKSGSEHPMTRDILSVIAESGVKVPKGALPVIIEALAAFEHGKTVKVVGEDEVLTTTEAARELGVSRPFLNSHLLAEDVIPFHMVGTHKRIYRADLEAYKEERNRRKKILRELTQETQDLGLGYDY